MAVENLQAFNNSVVKFAKTLVPAQQILFIKKISLQALRGVVLKTPVDTGRLRGNWLVSIDSVPSAPVEKTDRPGNSTISTGAQELAKVTPFSTVFITNNVEYAEFVEEGTPKKAPVKMLARTIEELRAQFP